MIQDEQTKNIKSILLLWSHKKQVGYNYNTDTIDHVSYCIRKKTPGEAAFNVDMWNEGRYLLTSGSGSPAFIDTQSCERFWQACGGSFSTTALIFCNIALNSKILRISSTTNRKLFLEETVYLHILSKLAEKALCMGCFHQLSSSPMMIFPACHHPLHCRQCAHCRIQMERNISSSTLFSTFILSASLLPSIPPNSTNCYLFPSQGINPYMSGQTNLVPFSVYFSLFLLFRG
jgi:hypothetical protein